MSNPDEQLRRAISTSRMHELTEALDAGASPDASASEGLEHVLHMTARIRDGSMLRALLVAGADVDKPTVIGSTALHLASRQGNAENVESLLRHGANISALTDGATALHVAAARRSSDVPQLLLRAGASYDALNKDGKTVEEAHANKNRTLGHIREAKQELGARIEPAPFPQSPQKADMLSAREGDGAFNLRNIGFWQQFDAALHSMKNAGTPLDADDRHMPDGSHLLDAASFFFAERKALRSMAKNGIGISAEDVFRPDGTAHDYVDTMGKHGTLRSLFQPELWKDRSLGELRHVMDNLREQYPESMKSVGKGFLILEQVKGLQQANEAIGR